VHPPLCPANLQTLYRAPLGSESLFGGLLTSTHQTLVQNMQVRPIVVNAPAPRARSPRRDRRPGSERGDQSFRRPHSQGPPRKPQQSRSQKRPSAPPQGPPAKRQSPAGASSFVSEPVPYPPAGGRARSKGQGGRSKGKGGPSGTPRQ
jgi:hypothetical protein